MREKAIWLDIAQVCDHVWQLFCRVFSSTSLSLMHYSAKLPLEVGLIRASWMYQISCIYIACMSPTLSVSSALQCVRLGDALEIRNGIIFDFY